jgi:hypothetical protein
MKGSRTSRFARPMTVAVVATMLVAVLPDVALAAGRARRTIAPSIGGGSVPHGFVDPGSTFKNTASFGGDQGAVEGTATFFLCGPKQPKNDSNVFPDGCKDGGQQVGDPVRITRGVATSADFTDRTENGFAAAYCWRVEFTPEAGSPYSAFSHTNSTTECVIAVLQVTIVTLSTPTGSGVAPGTAAFDTATITNDKMKPPSKVVDFFLCSPSEVTAGEGCVDGGTHIGSKNLSSGKAVSPTTRNTTTPGTYCWRAEYAGGFSPPDSIAPGEHTNWTTECFTVGEKRIPTVLTISNPTGGGVAPGTSIIDTATVTGVGGTPTGTVDFFLCGPAQVTLGTGCVDGGTLVGTRELGGGTAISPSVTAASEAGIYCWRAEYSGDDVFAAAEHTNATTECFEVLVTLPLRPSTTTTVSSPTGTQVIPEADLPFVVFDTATVTGDAPTTPTGSITFFLCGPGQGTEATDAGCATGGKQIGSPVTLNAAGVAVSATAALATSGTYCWRGEYSGDSAYLPSTHTNATTECFKFTTVLAIPPTRRPPTTLPRTGSGGPLGLPLGFALLAAGLLLISLTRREVVVAEEAIVDTTVRRGLMPRASRRDGPRRSIGPPVRAGPLLGAHA